jgi:hypothetical protein
MDIRDYINCRLALSIGRVRTAVPSLTLRVLSVAPPLEIVVPSLTLRVLSGE